MIDVELG